MERMRSVGLCGATDDADDMTSAVHVEEFNQTSGSVRVGWDEPAAPNGLILKYRLELTKVDGDGGAPEPRYECVRRKDFVDANKTKVLRDLAPGNYSVRVQAVSLRASKESAFTNYTYFYIQVCFLCFFFFWI